VLVLVLAPPLVVVAVREWHPTSSSYRASDSTALCVRLGRRPESSDFMRV